MVEMVVISQVVEMVEISQVVEMVVIPQVVEMAEIHLTFISKLHERVICNRMTSSLSMIHSRLKTLLFRKAYNISAPSLPV